MIRRPPRSTLSSSSAASDVYKRQDPMSPLRWTTKSLRHLAEELSRQGHPVSAPTVGWLLRENGFSLQGTAKTCLLYTSDAADEEDSVDLGGRRIIKKKKKKKKR